MKIYISTVKTMLLPLLFIVLSSGNCDGINVGYYYLPVPAYEKEDYVRMLRNPNPEIQYNAICALHNIADEQLLDQDTVKNSREYDRELDLYNSIFKMMDSSNTWISSAAIRFAGKYQYNRRGYLEHILSNNNPSINVQLVISNNFDAEDADSLVDPGLLARKIDFCFSHPSWLIQQCAYVYITPSIAHRFEKKLWNDYRHGSEQHGRLRPLAALGNHMCDTVHTLMEREYEQTKDTIVRKVIFALITDAPDKVRVLRWLRDRPVETFNALEQGSDLWDDTASSYPDLLVLALNQGMDSLKLKTTSYSGTGTETYPTLFDIIFKYKYDTEEFPAITPKHKAAIELIEEKIAANPETKKEWMAYASAKPKYHLPDALIREQLKITEAYNRSLTKLYDRYKVDSSLYNSYIRNLPSLYLSLTREKFRNPIR